MRTYLVTVRIDAPDDVVGLHAAHEIADHIRELDLDIEVDVVRPDEVPSTLKSTAQLEAGVQAFTEDDPA